MPWKWERFHPKAPPGEAETLVLRGEQLEPEKAPTEKKFSPKVAKEMSGAYELYRLGDFEKAQKIFHRIAENTSQTPPPIAEEARFYEAECLRRQLRYPRACDTYHKLLLDFNNGTYKDQSIQRIFDIANYWLDDTRKEMEASKNKGGKQDPNDLPKRPEAGPEEAPPAEDWKSKFAIGNWEKTKPLFDEEGRALEALDWVHLLDIRGPLADQCLWLMGRVKLYRENYRDADDNFTQLAKQYPNSKYAATAVELSILCKHMSTGGPDYDGRKVAEARQMIDTALKSYPILAHEKKEFLIRQLAACTMQQAEKDFRVAEFYRRTGHPGSAYFYYEIVRRRYPGTPFSDKATERMVALHHDLVKEQEDLKKKAEKPDHSDRETAPAPREAAPSMPPDELAPAPRQLPVETAPPPRPVPAIGQ